MTNTNEIAALKRLISWAYAQVCEHEETYRGGCIWEICSQCGARWADDRGGRPEFKYPEEIINAEAALAALQAEPVADREQLIKKFEALRDLHLDTDSDFDQGARYACKTIVGMLMTGDFDTPQPAKVPEGYNLSRESPEVITLTTPDSEIAFYAKAHDNRLYKFMEAMLNTAPAAGEGWVKCSERLPEARQHVLACQSRNGVIRTAKLESGTWKTGISSMDFIAGVTHWMPLPTPPSEDKPT